MASFGTFSAYLEAYQAHLRAFGAYFQQLWAGFRLFSDRLGLIWGLPRGILGPFWGLGAYFEGYQAHFGSFWAYSEGYIRTTSILGPLSLISTDLRPNFGPRRELEAHFGPFQGGRRSNLGNGGQFLAYPVPFWAILRWSKAHCGEWGLIQKVNFSALWGIFRWPGARSPYQGGRRPILDLSRGSGSISDLFVR